MGLFLATLIALCMQDVEAGDEVFCALLPEDESISFASDGDSLLQRARGQKTTLHDGSHRIESSKTFIPPAARGLAKSGGSAMLNVTTFAQTSLHKSCSEIRDTTTLFYHVHIPKTGGTTVANLLLADICDPFADHVTPATWTDQCNRTCDMGLSDNEFSCFPGRFEEEHNALAVDMERAEGLKATLGAQKIIYVTTLRSGSDRVISQWNHEVTFDVWLPPAGIPKFSNESLQLYITAGPHTTIEGRQAGFSQSNNLQVAQLTSKKSRGTQDDPVTRADLKQAKKMLMAEDWIIGFTQCMDKVQEKVREHAIALHGSCEPKVIPHEDHRVLLESKVWTFNRETLDLLARQSSLDNKLFAWAWNLAKAQANPRFAATC